MIKAHWGHVYWDVQAEVLELEIFGCVLYIWLPESQPPIVGKIRDWFSYLK